MGWVGLGAEFEIYMFSGERGGEGGGAAKRSCDIIIQAISNSDHGT